MTFFLHVTPYIFITYPVYQNYFARYRSKIRLGVHKYTIYGASLI